MIKIKKDEAIEFINYECDGRLEQIFKCLKYDDKKKVLYLVGRDVDLNINNEEELLN